MTSKWFLKIFSQMCPEHKSEQIDKCYIWTLPGMGCLQEFVGYYSILQSKLHFAQFFSSHWTEGFTDFPNYGSSRSILCVHIKVSFKYVPKGPIGKYRLVPYIRRAFLGNLIVDPSDVVGSSPVGAAPTTIPSPLNTWLQHIAQRKLQAETENNQI